MTVRQRFGRLRSRYLRWACRMGDGHLFHIRTNRCVFCDTSREEAR